MNFKFANQEKNNVSKGKLFIFLDFIKQYAEKINEIPNLKLEYFILTIYPILFAFFTFFHEPWFDEAQAWQIAKFATYNDILFYLPHYEGHPPFWHLFLSIFAKNNFPYEVTIKTISFVFSYLATILIVFKSPFSRIVRLILPFSYFLFYQYGIISRPYCFVMLLFSLLAINFYKKDKKPVFYALLLVFLSFLHPFCLVISSMLAFVWFIESIIKKDFKLNKVLSFGILGILLFAILFLILPSKEASAMNFGHGNTFIARFFYTLFMLPAECFITNIFNSTTFVSFSFFNYIFGAFAGIFIWHFLFLITKNNRELILTFLIPYITLAIVATKYLYAQHIGVIFCFIIFICWIAYSNPNKKINFDNKLLKNFYIFLLTTALITNLYWNFKSCILDIFITYAPNKNEINFIKKHNLDKYYILPKWLNSKTKEGNNLHNPIFNSTWFTIIPYFEKNIFYNGDNSNKQYVLHKKMSKEEIKKLFSHWEEKDLPDVLLGDVELGLIFDDIEISKKYTTVYFSTANHIQKGTLTKTQPLPIKIKTKLAKEMNLKPVETDYKEKILDLTRLTTYLFDKILIIKENREHKQ